MISPQPGLTPDLFRTINAMIYEWTGVRYDDKKLYLLENRIRRRLRDLGLPGFEEYVRLLKSASGGERDVFIDLVTIHETFFFRNAPQLNVFVSTALRETVGRLSARGERSMRIWSAACSTGEEPYTLAMMIEMERALPPGMDFTILATDISAEAVKTARRGLYGPYSIRNTPPEYIRGCFNRVDEKNQEVKESVKKRVRVEQMNLLDSAGGPAAESMDIVFCRNVLIYFDTEVRRRVVGALARSLKPGGFLFIGHAESLHGVSDEFAIEMVSGVPVYRKKG